MLCDCKEADENMRGVAMELQDCAFPLLSCKLVCGCYSDVFYKENGITILFISKFIFIYPLCRRFMYM
jgi:hypothetical protein